MAAPRGTGTRIGVQHPISGNPAAPGHLRPWSVAVARVRPAGTCPPKSRTMPGDSWIRHPRRLRNLAGDPVQFLVEMLVLGIGVGLISGALGLGGGIIMVPAFLFFVPGMDVHTAKGTSLLVILFVAAVNAWDLNRHVERAPWGLAGRLAVGAVVGSYLGAWVTTLVSDTVVLVLFVTLLLLMAWQLFGAANKPPRPHGPRPWWLSGSLIGIYSGLAGGATGTGGGLILVPLTLQTGLTTNKNATAVSNMVMVVIAAAGSVAHFFAPASGTGPWVLGHVNLYVVPWVFLGAQAGALAGRRINRHLSLKWRRITLAVLLLLIVVSLVLREWG